MDDLTSLDIPLHTLYSCCLDTLKSISALALPSESFKTYHARLKIWGAGLFTEGPSLDKILEEEPKRYGPLLAGLQKTLFSIAVEEVVFLKSRQAHNGNNDVDLQLEPQTKQLLDLVSGNSIAISACERRLPRLVNTSKIGTSVFTQNLTPSSNQIIRRKDQPLTSQGASPGFINRLSKKLPAANEVISLFSKKEDTVGRVRATSPLLGEHGLKEDGNASLRQPSEACHEDYDMYLGAFVESLFDLLPSIRGIRRTRLLETEFHQSNEESSGSGLIRQATLQSARTLPGSKIPSDRDNPGSAQRFSSPPSDRGSTLLGSDNDNSRLMSDDEDDIDARSETIYDSTRTGATGSSHSAIRMPPIDTIFDESPPPHLPHKSDRITKKSLRTPSYSDRLPSSYTTTAFGFSMSDLILTRNLALSLYFRYLEGAHGADDEYLQLCKGISALLDSLEGLASIVWNAEEQTPETLRRPDADIARAMIVKTLLEVTGDFTRTLDDCEKLLSDKPIFQLSATGFVENVVKLGPDKRVINDLRQRVDDHWTKIDFIAKPFELHLLRGIYYELQQVRKDAVPLQGILVKDTTQSIHPKRPKPHDVRLTVPPDLAKRFETQMPHHLPLSEGFGAAILHLANSTVRFKPSPGTRQNIPEAAEFVYLLKSAWITEKLKESDYLQSAGPESFWADCTRELEDKISEQESRFETGELEQPTPDVIARLPDHCFAIWLHEESLPQPTISAEQGPLGDKILELALPSVDGNQRSTLTVFRKSDIAFRLVSTTKDEQKPGFSVEKSVNVDMNSARFIPAFATPDPGGPINNKVLLCNSQGQDRICHTFQDSSAIAEFQRALLGYRVLNYMSNISWHLGFSKFGQKAISGKARLQLWQLKPFPDLLSSLASQQHADRLARAARLEQQAHDRARSLSPRSRYEEEKRAIRDQERQQHADRIARAARLEQQAHDRARSLSPRSRYEEEKRAIREEERQQLMDRLARAARLEQEAHDRAVRLAEDERRNRRREGRPRRLIEFEERRQIDLGKRARRRQQREEEERYQRRRGEARRRQEEADREQLRQQQDRMAEQEHLERLRRANIPLQPRHQPTVHRESLANREDRFEREAIRENARQWVREGQMPPAAYGRYDGGFLGRRNTIDGSQWSRGDGIALARPEPPVLVIFTMCENKYTFFHIKIERGLSVKPQKCSKCQDQNKTCSGVLIQSSSKEWNFRTLSAQLDNEQGLDSWDLACFRYPEHPAFQNLEQVTGVKNLSLHFETPEESELFQADFEWLSDGEFYKYDRMQPKARREIFNYDGINPLSQELQLYRMKLQGRRDPDWEDKE